MITSEGRSTYAKCEMIGDYNAIFEVLSERINIKYVSIVNNFIKISTSSYNCYIDNKAYEFVGMC